MRISLLVTSGPGIGRSGHAGPGKPLYVGRGVVAHLRVPEDPSLLNVHFEIECSETVCRLRDMSGPAGTKVNGQLVRAAELKEGDTITAGKSTFEVRPPAAMPPASGSAPTLIRPAPATVHSGPRPVIDVLRREPERLFVLLDAVRDSSINGALANGGEKHQPLYDNPRGEQSAFVAPHLVELSPTKPFTESLLTAGWGKSWGVFLTCKLPFDEVLTHLRDCLQARLVVGGKPVYFRFYDPRVLRGFLPSCTADEGIAFFGPISAFLMEAEQPTALVRVTPPTKLLSVAVVPPS